MVDGGRHVMGSKAKSLPRRVWDGLTGLLPGGDIDDDGPPPDIDGRRDAGYDRDRAVITAKSQLSPHGQGATSYERVDRTNSGGD